MAKIKTIEDESNEIIYPVTSSKAVYHNGQLASEILDEVCVEGADGSKIPKAFIDMWDVANQRHPSDAKYNYNTGYFEINGLTDVTYEQAMIILSRAYNPPIDSSGWYQGFSGRTNFVFLHDGGSGGIARGNSGINLFCRCECEVINVGWRMRFTSQPMGIFNNASKVHTIKDMISFMGVSGFSFTGTNNGPFYNMKELINCDFRELEATIHLSESSKLSAQSVWNMINYAVTPKDFSITLHGDAYARAMADQRIVDLLATKTNITLVSI